LADLAERRGNITLHQLAHESAPSDGDVYATPAGTTKGYRIDGDGQVSEMDETFRAQI
jgi:hypothetical protein